MSARSWLFTFFGVLLIYGGIAGYYATYDRDPPRVIELLFIASTVVLLYLWYYFDAEEHHFKRTSLLGGCIVLFSIITVPYYLVRSRPRGQRLRALVKFFGLLLLSVLAVFVGGLPFVLLQSGA